MTREEVLVHWIPEAIPVTIEITAPPAPRDSSAMKPVFDMGSLDTALGRVRAKGGIVTARTFNVDGLARHDVLDPDGNVIQLRCRMA
jgi:predicted enzyme related to lactoylglutathione lyase